MKIIVTGSKGQLGHDVVQELNSKKNYQVLGIDIEDLEITNRKAVDDFFDKFKPNVIIHCAAYTAVDKAEDNIKLCMNVNVNGTRNLVESAKKFKAKFIYISTDYVFDGDKKSEYFISDDARPKSVYGKSKLGGEKEVLKYNNHFIIRISWVFGKNGNNFVKTILRIARERDSVNVVDDQIGSPTYTHDLSKLISDLIETNKYGIYHATNEGYCSWYEFAQEIFRLTKIENIVNPISSSKYKTKAKRPMNSRMDKSSIDINGFRRLPHWKDSLKRYLEELGEI